jgi:ATP-dependent helicase/nuclease subunit B
VQTRFLLGPAGSGKTFRCLAEVRAALANNPDGNPLIFLAPKQATFQIERQLLDSEQWGERPREPKSNPADDSPGVSPHQINGFTRLNIFSFDRLAQFIFEKLNIAPPKLLSTEGRLMVLRALLQRHADELKLFRGSARRAGFAQELGGLLAELQQHQFTPAKLRDLAAKKNLRGELRDKLHDLALLSEKYAGWLRENKLQDAENLLDFATDALRENFHFPLSTFRFSALWLDGFAEMTPQELDLLAAFLPFCENATLAFCLDESGANEKDNSWLSIWNVVGKSFKQCRQRIENLPDCKIKIEILPRDSEKNRFAKNTELAWLEANWSQQTQKPKTKNQNSVRTVSCANADAEAIFAAREILKFVRNGNRFRDCAILVRNLENYHKPLAREFRRYGIPFFLDRRESVSHHPLAELTRSALRTIIFDWRQDDLFAALKSGFCDCDETEIDRLENAALEFGWRGKKWREPLPDENLERLRKIIFPPFENFHEQLAKLKFQPNGKQLAEIFRELWSDLKIEQQLQSWSDDSKTDSTIQRSNDSHNIHSTVWEQMNLWLENLALAFPREPLPLRDWLPILEAGLASLTVGVVPPVLDEVLIGAIDRARNPNLKFTLVLGVNETIFPATPKSPAILTSADRDELEGQKIALGPNLYEQISRERFLGYIACTRASEKLAVTFSRQNADGKILNPSPFIAHLQKIFPALEIEEFQNEIKLSDAEHANEIAPLIFEIKNQESKSKSWLELLQIPALADLNKNFRQLREPDPQENLSPALAEKLYGLTLRTSVSRLEEFAACPFRFFVRSGLRADERKVFELDARERGSFQHDVLKKFHDDLMSEGKRWRDIEPAEARERIGKIAAAQTENYHDGLLSDTAESRFAARALAESLQDFVVVIVAWLRGQNDFDPSAAELEFDSKPGARVPAWEIDLGGGHKLSLHGRIDRVDLWQSLRTATDEAAVMVIDYKSSSKKLDKVLVEHGVQLQLLAYLNVLRHWKNPQAVFGVKRLVPAGVFYVNLRGEYKSGGSRTEILADADESRRKAYRHTGRFDAGVLDKLDRVKAKDQFSYQLKNNGELYANSIEAMPRAEFEKLLDGVETQLREMGGRIFSGAAQVDPYRKGKQTPCEFCDYQAACRIDKWTHQYRVLRAAKEEMNSAEP